MEPAKTLKVLELEQQIKDILGQDTNHQVNFNYQESDGHVQLNLETINPKYNQMFLYHSETGIDKLDVLRKTLNYTKNFDKVGESYTIQWSDHDQQGVRTSYFHARSVEEALEKFRYGRDRNRTTIFLISLNPKA